MNAERKKFGQKTALRQGIRRKWMLMLVLLVCLMFNGYSVETVLAGSKTIHTVSIKVSSKLEAGKSLPDIETDGGTASDGEVSVSCSGDKYTVSEAEWVDKNSKAVKSGDEPRMKVTLSPVDVSEYYFQASYKSSNVKISSGTFVSAKRDGDDLVVTLRVKGVKGEYDPPADVYWNEDKLGQAKWDKPENTSGYYELQLYRDEKSIYKVDQVSGTQYNFYPYMTQEGDYSFKVRTIPVKEEQVKYGTKSEWVASGDLTITDRYVSDGKGQQSKDATAKKAAVNQVGWIQEENHWYYRFPDGSLASGCWQQIEGFWYYFDVDGAMKTGWQQINGEWYYLYDSGQMAVGWVRLNGVWYFFHNGQEGAKPEGSRCDAGWHAIGAYYYYFNEDGSLYTGWLEQNGSRYYLNTVDNSLQGALFTGWIIRDNKTYFADSNGVIAEGWYEIDGNYYYFYPETGEMAVNTQINGFYVNENGVWVR